MEKKQVAKFNEYSNSLLFLAFPIICLIKYWQKADISGPTDLNFEGASPNNNNYNKTQKNKTKPITSVLKTNRQTDQAYILSCCTHFVNAPF